MVLVTRIALALLLCASSCAAAAPVVFTGGVVNAASFRPSNAPGSGVAPGSIASVFGASLASETRAASTLPLPLSLVGVEVSIGGVRAPLFFVSAGQINVQVPWEVAPGVAAVVVRNPDGASSPVDVRVLPAAPGIFTLSGDGLGRGAAQSFFSREDVRINGVDSPARPNQVVTVYFTGGGSVISLPPAGSPGRGERISGTLTVVVAGRPALVQFAGLAPGLAGLNQANVVIPPDVPEGCYLPLQLSVDGAASNMVSIAVSNGADCRSAPTGSVPLVAVKPRAEISIDRALLIDVGSGRVERPINGFFRAHFLEIREVSSLVDSGYPPAGAGCDVNVMRSDGRVAIGVLVSARGLDAGQLFLTGSNQTWTFPGITGSHQGQLGVAALAPGIWTLSGSGGRDVGPFGPVELPIDALFAVTNFGFQGRTFARSAPLSLAWTCPAPRSNAQVMVQLTSFNREQKLLGSLACTALCRENVLTLGPAVLGQLPASSEGGATIGVFFNDDRFRGAFRASGIDEGTFGYFDSAVLIGATAQ